MPVKNVWSFKSRCTVTHVTKPATFSVSPKSLRLVDIKPELLWHLKWWSACPEGYVYQLSPLEKSMHMPQSLWLLTVTFLG